MMNIKYIAKLLPLFILFNTYACSNNTKQQTQVYSIETSAWDYEGDGRYDEIRENIKEYRISNGDTTLVWMYPANRKKIDMTKQEIMNEYGPDVIFYDGVCDEEGKN